MLSACASVHEGWLLGIHTFYDPLKIGNHGKSNNHNLDASPLCTSFASDHVRKVFLFNVG